MAVLDVRPAPLPRTAVNAACHEDKALPVDAQRAVAAQRSVSMNTPFTCVRQPPMRMPLPDITGMPSFISEISVVVPPISTIRQSLLSVSARPPCTLAAGPLSIVSTGLRRARLSAIRLPSLRTIMTVAAMPRQGALPP